ncbi:PorP/SprF family type IX secretion system membrane protein [Paraflavisolibacter sp. H34]|uniref:PorP/SprF family type IX secretion system membrane protein n=1 Tax=Huijunlia imazamoxiresistens TaxID=3127457 RepID=UPI00301904CE
MKNRFLAKLLVTVSCLWGGSALAQDMHFSQFYASPLYRNPALAGIVNGDVRVQVLHRSQWNNVANAYKTSTVNAEYKMPVGSGDDFLTTALQLFHDQSGTANLTTTQVLPALNYHKSLSTERSTYLSVGFMGGVVQRRFDRSKITTNSSYDGMGDGESMTNPQYSYLDGSAGISLNSSFGENKDNNFIVGAAYHHFNKPRNSFYANSEIELSPKYVLSGSLKLGLDEASFVTFEADHSRQGTYQETIGGMLYGLRLGDDLENPAYTIQAGGFLRLNDAFIPTVRVDYQPFSLGLSYDANISGKIANGFGRNGFELSLVYAGFLKRPNSSLNAMRCPRF